MSGFVSFVGSGPGDPELLTVKAVNRISKADAVLFDDLSAGPILAHAKPSADLVGVGKRAGRKSPKQNHVSKLLVDFNKETENEFFITNYADALVRDLDGFDLARSTLAMILQFTDYFTEDEILDSISYSHYRVLINKGKKLQKYNL